MTDYEIALVLEYMYRRGSGRVSIAGLCGPSAVFIGMVRESI